MDICEALSTLKEVVAKTDAVFTVINEQVYTDQKEREAFQESAYKQTVIFIDKLRDQKVTNGDLLEICHQLFQQQVSRFLTEV